MKKKGFTLVWVLAVVMAVMLAAALAISIIKTIKNVQVVRRAIEVERSYEFEYKGVLLLARFNRPKIGAPLPCGCQRHLVIEDPNKETSDYQAGLWVSGCDYVGDPNSVVIKMTDDQYIFEKDKYIGIDIEAKEMTEIAEAVLEHEVRRRKEALVGGEVHEVDWSCGPP